MGSVLGLEQFGMGDRPGNSSRVHTSEHKVCRKDMCYNMAWMKKRNERNGDVKNLLLVETTSEDKVYRKDMCWSTRAVYDL
ncbi:Os03g0235400 [Oryza sativa Japonica Group]|uniref:Os03g0235400 protein n=2 Tax=Oryza sativa subsp. japonica TaxID=39947 RepID=C7IZT1_ORYSJ|nr:hypothetical protein EE612_016351 [Oryza sativa]BAH92063.1 Os03g0235400 [Oryza sativa Japonica Group]BAS83144.1 Os03g0235400 [Oryza sativa Japonica Group]|eukprot:NP_001173335.1 Os03g0235400 [Oryza sativa Japonica Group]